MEKLEKHIKKTLKQREIAPSPLAWERIAGELDKSGGKKKKFPVFAVAASVLAIFTLGVLLFLVLGEDTKTSVLVDVEEKKQSQPKQENTTPILVEEKEQQLVESKIEESETQSKASNTELTPIKDHNEVVAVETQTQEEEKVAKVLQAELSEDLITLKLNEVLAEVVAMENGSVQVTDAEIDSLLLLAQRQLLTERIGSIDQEGKVDAMALLNEVELELFESDRNQLFDRLKESFFKLRTAVADRNK